MTDIRERLLAAFLAEHKEYLDGIRSVLSKLEKDGGAGTGAELEEVFRLAHSLRAAARVCDFRIVEQIGQRLESFFSLMRKGSLRPGKSEFDALRSVLDDIDHWTRALAERREAPEPGSALTAMDRLLASGGREERPAPPTRAETDDLKPKLLAAFQIEHREHLEGIRAILAEFEKGGVVTPPNIDEAFRRAHSLKGAARLAELRGAETLAHRLENLFARMREGTLRLNAEIVRVIHLGLDTIEDGAASLLTQRTPPDSGKALAAIDRVLAPGDKETRRQEDKETGRQGDKETERRSLPAAPSPSIETVRVSAGNLDRLLRSTGQLLTENLRQNLVAQELNGLSRAIDGLRKEWESVRNTSAVALRALAEAPALAHVVRYLNLVEHQVRALSRQARSVRRLQQRSSWTLGHLGRQLQQEVRRVRMVPAASIFQGFRKMVRDLAHDENKEIDFRVSGFEIEADRMVLQALKDPLIHIVCNAVSHGIESSDERREQGKSAVSRITLQMEAAGNRLRIAVEDDGRGIDPQRIADTAVQRGFLSAAEAEKATKEELLRLIFQPGFSTAQRVTDVSGRGMGLSVVHETVARLHGDVDLQSKDGSGTRLVLSVPLSIATQRLLLVRCQNQTFALPVHAIVQLLRVKIQDVESVEGKPMLLLQGQPVSLLSLAHLLRMNDGDVAVPDTVLPVAILRAGTRRVAVIVDAFLQERDTLIKDLDSPASQCRGLTGGILMEDGSVVLVLNTTELLTTFNPADRPAALKPSAISATKKQATVLVVDDSLTTRTLEKSLLEAHGYKVRIAMDGVEALTQLESELPDLVITDIQMPRMDGFQLLEEMKRDPRLASIPVIVVTSMAQREDQERGLALGADAYIVKRKFDHQDLLETIRQLI